MDTEVLYATRDASIEGFCRRQGISRSSYYNLRNAGNGPREYSIGKQVRITAEAENAWIKQREAARSGRA